jgi:hypothetical protein
MDRVHYLGYIIDQHGVHVDPAKIQVIHDWLAPTTLTELGASWALPISITGSCWDSPILHGPSTK